MICDRPPVQFTRGGNPLIELRRHQVPRIESLAPIFQATWLHGFIVAWTPDPPIALIRNRDASTAKKYLQRVRKEKPIKHA